ncbi:hypothetical protein QTJ16_006173 [Diplocarpon rosae]|uniref:Peptidase A1 domain-containing protein n=1 Tax=Diplocarpon rosae TaxID=946125 RepID=A0AAD9SW45_9HELO|nr:hypothetical protein QTJ16_006173 [Diplocarpon rosae]
MHFTTRLALLGLVATVSAAPFGNSTKSAVIPLKLNIKTSSAKILVTKGRNRLASLTWCGAHDERRYRQTSTGESTGSVVSSSYGSGLFLGSHYSDITSVGGLTVKYQSIGAAIFSLGFNENVDGIFGLGPISLTVGLVEDTNLVPTFLNNLMTQGSISTEVFGLYLKPGSGSDTSDADGELTIGDINTARYTGELSYFPVLTDSLAAVHWGLEIEAFTFGLITLASFVECIIDTGTTMIYIPRWAYSAFLDAANGETDFASGLAVFTTKPTANFGIRFGSITYDLTPEQYLVPEAQYKDLGLTSGKYYAWISDGGDSEVNTVIGQKFLENYYSVFDTTNARIGFATRA